MITRKTMVTVDGETHSIEDWVAFHPERGLTVSAVLMRVKNGMSSADAVTIPRMWHRSRKEGGTFDRAIWKAKEDLESYEYKKTPIEPIYEWRFISYSSHSGQWEKVQVN